MTANPIPASDTLTALRKRAATYFTRAGDVVGPPERYSSTSLDHWEQLPGDLQEEASMMARDIVEFGRSIALPLRRSPLLTEADSVESGHAIKGMRAALRLRRYQHWDPEVLHDEGDVLGIRPGGDTENVVVHPAEAATLFHSWAQSMQDRLDLLTPAEGTAITSEAIIRRIPAGYRPGTAFVMMWMAPDHPELADISGTVKRCFDDFGIRAVRSDDIEHEEVITQRILDEIKTVEFLFADLTGERPSVYYEVGYAHALGRRVIMFRKAGTPIHFDLAAYNCPEYQNLTDLDARLTKRLEHVTGKVSRRIEKKTHDT